MNVCLKQLKAFLAPEVRKEGSPIAPIIGTRVEFLDLSFFDFLDLDKFLIVSLALPPPPPTTSFSAPLEADPDDPVVFNIDVSGAVILLKLLMKRQ